MPIVPILTRLIQTGNASAHVQRIAAAVTDAPPADLRRLGVALAGAPDLPADVRDKVLLHKESAVRAVAWRRDDVTDAERLNALALEVSATVLTSVVGGVQDVHALEVAIRARTENGRKCQALWTAIADAERWDLPGELVVRALNCRGTRRGDSLPAQLAASGRDLSALLTATDVEISALYRLAACASVGTPDAVVAAHLERVLATKSLTKTEDHATRTTELLRLLAERIPNAEVLAAYLQGRQHFKPLREEEDELTAAWQRWQPQAGSPTPVTDRLNQGRTPQDVEAVWESLTEDQRRDMAPVVVRHEMCPARVYHAACAASGEQLFVSARFNPPLWSRQDEDLFKDQLRRNALVMTPLIHAGKDCPWSPDQATLIGWALEVLAQTHAEDDPRWVTLLENPQFPKDRLGDVPPAAIAVALEMTGSRPALGWVTTTLVDLFAGLDGGDPTAHAAVLSSALGPTGSLPGMLVALCHSSS